MVVDYRALNAATVTDAHPLPRIEDILQPQGRYRMWSVLDMKNGYLQVPMRKSDRHLTCMSTLHGPKQWIVLVVGLKNAGAIFQRVMEWALRDLEGVDVYVDDVIVGSTGATWDELVENHDRALRAVMERLAHHDLKVEAKKAQLFMEEIEFCGHIMRVGRRWPYPGKLLAVQKWQLPLTVSQLRGFMGS